MSTPSTPSPTGRVALVVHPARPEAGELAEVARSWWERHGYAVVETSAPEEGVPPVEVSDLQFAISLGGDGTMLRTVQLVVANSTPVLGVNVGHLGYLTQVEPAAMEGAFARLVAGDFEIEERITLEVTVQSPGGGVACSLVALNDAAVEKTGQGHSIRLAVSIAGRHFLDYLADGMVVATATGSTAYNFSLRGPIVSPRLRALVLTPIAPHMLFDRSLVLEPEETVRLELQGERAAVLVVDGSPAGQLSAGDVVSLGAGKHPARVVRFGSVDFHAILRAKFGLMDR